MTEAEWLCSTDLQAMLTYLRTGVSVNDRKLRLFTCACCRLIWDFPNDDRPRRAVEVAERYADGLAGADIMAAYCDTNACLLPLGRRYTHHPPAEVMDSAFIAFHRTTSTSGAYYGHAWEYKGHDAYACAGDAVERVASVAVWSGEDLAAVQRREATLLRDIIGNPFHPPLLCPPSATTQVVAQSAYDDRLLPSGHLHPARLAELAAALEDAGGTDAELLGHLRGEGPHCRGCWGVDAVLGKS